MPLATGERLYSRWDFRDVLSTGIAVAQPDVSHAGGITEVRRIAALAETYDVSLAPHCPLGPIALAASLQLAFAMPNFLIQEHSIGIHYNAGSEPLDYLMDTTVFDFTDGYVALPGAARPRHRNRRAGGPAGRRDRTPMAQPAVARSGRLFPGMVRGDPS